MSTPKKKYDFLSGEVLLFDKEKDWTSFDLVQRVRNTLCKKMGIKKMKVGHAGTLDPLATGLMILCTGKATKQIESFQDKEKQYVATLKVGATTPSYDLETEEENIKDYSYITQKQVELTIRNFVGEIEQTPPIFSAVKIQGRRAFDYARKGEKVKMRTRFVTIRSIDILEYNLPYIKIKVNCSKGTYIRALARDIGEELKCGAYLSDLRRTKIGDFDVENAFSVQYFLDNLDLFVTN